MDGKYELSIDPNNTSGSLNDSETIECEGEETFAVCRYVYIPVNSVIFSSDTENRRVN